MYKFYFIFTIILFLVSNINAQIKILFRYDDYEFVDKEFNDSLLNVFEKNNIPINIGIIPFDENNIPFDCDSLQLERIKKGIKNKTIDVAQHGYNHQNIDNKYTEFNGIGINEQYNRIYKGKYFLDSLFNFDLKTFIPPWNSYDSATLKVLDSLNFSCISADKWGNSASSKIKYLPDTYEGIKNLEELLKNNKDENAIIIILIHKYAFENYKSEYITEKITFNQLDTLLSWANNNYKCCTFSEILEQNIDIDINRFHKNVDYVNSISNYVGEKFNNLFLNINIYYSIKYLNFIKKLDIIIWTLTFIIIFVSVFLFLKITKINYKFLSVISIMALVVLFMAFYRRYYSMEWLIISNLSIYGTISLIIILLIKLKKKLFKN